MCYLKYPLYGGDKFVTLPRGNDVATSPDICPRIPLRHASLFLTPGICSLFPILAEEEDKEGNEDGDDDKPNIPPSLYIGLEDT